LFKTNSKRTANRDAMSVELDATFVTKPVAFWLQLLERAEVPAGPVNTIDQVFKDPQVRHRKLLRHAPHPQFGDIPMLANALRFSQTPVDTYNAPPELGADTRNVLRERLGLDAAACDQLAADGVI
jgi:crotonobetainyl-CoA:carnitine CoA-transferase CaiB-like acyl-CoA transferase